MRRKRELHWERIAEVIDDDLDELPIESFFDTLKLITKKPGGKYDFIKKSGSSYIEALFNLFQLVWRVERIPTPWQISYVTQIPKSGQNTTDLANVRNIHVRNITAKFFSQILLSHAKDNLIESMTIFQLACKPGHRPVEHLYVVKSVIAHYSKQKKGILVSGYNIRTFFDSEDIYDVFGEVYLSQVKGKVYRLLFEMNKSTQIIIRTPVGDSEARSVGAVITQGGIESAILSSVSIDRGTDVAFATSDCEAVYHGTQLAPLRWMDDILRVGESIASAQYANNLVEDVGFKRPGHGLPLT